MRLRNILLALSLMVAMIAPAARQVWEEVERVPMVVSEELRTAPSDNDPVTVVADGYVYISVPQDTNVKVFTILGQLVDQRQLRQGTHRVKISTKGIYLFKIGSTTRRVII